MQKWGEYMLTNEEKTKKTLAILNLMQEGKNTKAFSLLKELLMQDTTNGKLYKYRAFNKHTLQAIATGTLYAAKPTSFNDPFDCKFGVTPSLIYNPIYTPQINEVRNLMEKFMAFITGEIKENSFSPDELRIIDKIIASPIYNQFHQIKVPTNPSKEEVSEYISKTNAFQQELCRIIYTDEKYNDTLGHCTDLLPVLFDNTPPYLLSELSKCGTDINKYASALGIHEDTDEIGKQALILNKLFPEMTYKDDFDSKTISSISNLFNIACLATSNKNKLMWSHYANSHKGICLEYDFSKITEKELNVMPFPVLYQTNRPQIPVLKPGALSKDIIPKMTGLITLGLLEKDSAWEYENEWRILCPKSKSFIEMPRISAIYLGASMITRNKNRVIKIADEFGIPVKQMTVDRGKYDLHVKDL